MQILVDFAAACRKSLSRLSSEPGSSFHGFPNGACGSASELMGILLQQRLGVVAQYVCGEDHLQLPHNQSHAWLEVHGYAVDITYDQFPEARLVGWVWDSRTDWHKGFGEIRSRAVCSPEDWPAMPVDGYEAMREELLRL